MAGDLIRMEHINKFYGRVHALDDVNFVVREREIVGLLGDNGAGKSTLIKVLSGAVPITSGAIYVHGKRADIRSTADAIAQGIETIYQDSALVPQLSIARNLFLGREPLRIGAFGVGLLDQERMRRESVRAIADVDLHLRSPEALVGELSGGQRQGVAIARAMHFKSKLLILDEPTNHLSVKETNKVLGFIRGLKPQGVTGIFISHNIHHVFQCCDRLIAMARGEIVFDRAVDATSIDEIQEML